MDKELQLHSIIRNLECKVSSLTEEVKQLSNKKVLEDNFHVRNCKIKIDSYHLEISELRENTKRYLAESLTERNEFEKQIEEHKTKISSLEQEIEQISREKDELLKIKNETEKALAEKKSFCCDHKEFENQITLLQAENLSLKKEKLEEKYKTIINALKNSSQAIVSSLESIKEQKTIEQDNILKNIKTCINEEFQIFSSNQNKKLIQIETFTTTIIKEIKDINKKLFEEIEKAREEYKTTINAYNKIKSNKTDKKHYPSEFESPIKEKNTFNCVEPSDKIFSSKSAFELVQKIRSLSIEINKKNKEELSIVENSIEEIKEWFSLIREEHLNIFKIQLEKLSSIYDENITRPTTALCSKLDLVLQIFNQFNVSIILKQASKVQEEAHHSIEHLEKYTKEQHETLSKLKYFFESLNEKEKKRKRLSFKETGELNLNELKIFLESNSLLIEQANIVNESFLEYTSKITSFNDTFVDFQKILSVFENISINLKEKESRNEYNILIDSWEQKENNCTEILNKQEKIADLIKKKIFETNSSVDLFFQNLRKECCEFFKEQKDSNLLIEINKTPKKEVQEHLEEEDKFLKARLNEFHKQRIEFTNKINERSELIVKKLSQLEVKSGFVTPSLFNSIERKITEIFLSYNNRSKSSEIPLLKTNSDNLNNLLKKITSLCE